ncbi:hypothetical protein G6F21_014739 [Rhizopus arrhizus]|nr:hypothetical protein G6F24_018852 [Rhizopus arrhizus]KAG0771474.1 hypothetical protein G6F21_014739 [Rhizopus arrhizus]KAG1363110.1 hypothetical protein G6F60_015777 [Rhizopus arrhizus]KAG1476303.1 hypothetical protein G6F53_014318 [Rhizopus delemar]
MAGQADMVVLSCPRIEDEAAASTAGAPGAGKDEVVADMACAPSVTNARIKNGVRKIDHQIDSDIDQ